MSEKFEEIIEEVFGPESLDEQLPISNYDDIVRGLDDLGLLSLREIVKIAQQKLNECETQELQAAREQVKGLAAKFNISPTELVAESLAVKPNGGTKGPQKVPKTGGGYRNPNDPNKIWSGKGRPPGWFQAALDAGITRESMKI